MKSTRIIEIYWEVMFMKLKKQQMILVGIIIIAIILIASVAIVLNTGDDGTFDGDGARRWQLVKERRIQP